MPGNKQRSAFSYMVIPLILSVLALAWGLWEGGIALALSLFLLIVLEVSLSLDNAVVNAHVLQHWNAFWRKLFLTVGILVAVFGMRLVFPILIVTVTTGMGWGETIRLALTDSAEYGRRLHEVHHLVGGFGGAFLCMVGLTYLLDTDKDVHWLGPIENILAKAGQIEAVQAALTLLVAVAVSSQLATDHQFGFVVAALLGVVTYVATKALGTIATGGGGDVGDKIIRGGIGGFLYLELLDASFSFDGVIGAFAITTNLVVITIGLGIGAFAVRELTLMAVDRGTLTEYRYLEHGAFWAIIALGVIMLVSPIWPVPEVVTGLIGAILIGAAFISSLLANRTALKNTLEGE